MNKENLIKIADYVETVPQETFDMEAYRDGDNCSIECNSVGCVTGHAAKLIRMLVDGKVTIDMLDEWRSWDKPQY